MSRIRMGFAMVWALGTMVVGCGAGPTAGAPLTTTPGASAEAPCADSDCAPCDETKGKCMGPSVCNGHPERAKRVCMRGPGGACQSQLLCE